MADNNNLKIRNNLKIELADHLDVVLAAKYPLATSLKTQELMLKTARILIHDIEMLKTKASVI